MNTIIDKIMLPNIYVRVGGALSGGCIGYLFSKSSKEHKYKVKVPEKLHIAPAILTGAIGAYIPIVPFITTIGITLLTGTHSYCLWERKVLDDIKKQG